MVLPHLETTDCAAFGCISYLPDHTAVFGPTDTPDPYVNRHNTDEWDEENVFDERCPRCRMEKERK
jgi:hypothetical protein